METVIDQDAGQKVDEKCKEEKSFVLKTPKGTRDFGPAEMAVRDRIFATITAVFRKHGAVTIDTPVFELKEVLTGKYGEDSKLIYDLEDQGGELCSLRYDLTVPLARYLAMNKTVRQIKRWQIAKVYRRDQPYMTKGRFREFFQCDFDIAGENYEPLVPDAEVVKVIQEILRDVKVGPFVIKLNHRKLLDGIFEVAGVPADKFRAISSAVDKLDKVAWGEVRQEMLDKGLPLASCDVIGEYVCLGGGGAELLETLAADPKLSASSLAMQGIGELRALNKFLFLFHVPRENYKFDPSLARGLDYYTGMILEAVLTEPGQAVGSIAGGGRYDSLVGMFSSQAIPCVGASVGIDRIFSILYDRTKDTVRQSPTFVLVAAAGADLLEERMQLCAELWHAGFAAELTMKRKVKALDQFGYCERHAIPYAVVLGPGELEQGVVKLRRIGTRTEEVVARDELLAVLKCKLQLEQDLCSQLAQLGL
jgi:histidyl-tRNA synthetase